ncbi:MAG: endonuclease MutS2 [Flavobacteriales bacterium]
MSPNTKRPFTDEQTLKELQFFEVLNYLKTFAVSESAQNKISKIQPSNSFKHLRIDLLRTKERLDILQRRIAFPALSYEELINEIMFLGKDDGVLTLEGFIRIYSASALINSYLDFFDHNPRFTELIKLFESCYLTLDINASIEKIIDVRQTKNIKDDATPALAKIRHDIRQIRQKINRNFDRELRRLLKEGFLAETHESFVANRRVLSVQSTYKRRVPGSILGTSKTGSLTFIEPKVNEPLSYELDCLLDDERSEMYRILKGLTHTIRHYLPLIEAYQNTLVSFDIINAKARMAANMEATLPSLQNTHTLDLKNAFHPLLRSHNDSLQKKTIPQQLRLNEACRMLVISGPNAGGKSLTLKTFGLLQSMLQAGMLIPVHPDSTACFFDQLYSDIGDNQSIENELSTYSYRLKRMKYFLQIFDAKSILLLDEFGSGSDPELGAALAEVFFNRLAEKNGFAILTTHYSSIKNRATEMEGAMNGAMRFDVSSLAPLYELELGLPGSSFTFEVAQKMGIDKQSITEAKKRLGADAKALNGLLGTLQQDKRYLQKMTDEYRNAQERMQEELEELKAQKEAYNQKAKQLRIQNDEQTKWITLGQRFEKYLERFNPNPKKRLENDGLFDDIRSFFIKSKTKPKNHSKKAAKGPKETNKKPLVIIQIGQKVRISGSKQTGIVDSIHKNTANVLVNSMKISVPIDKITIL